MALGVLHPFGSGMFLFGLWDTAHNWPLCIGAALLLFWSWAVRT